VASIAVILYLAGRALRQRHRALHGAQVARQRAARRRPALRIIVEGLQADDARTEQILRNHVALTEALARA
jgi:ATP-dependent Clp protease protease subunit